MQRFLVLDDRNFMVVHSTGGVMRIRTLDKDYKVIEERQIIEPHSMVF